jgi:hypothetical protein
LAKRGAGLSVSCRHWVLTYVREVNNGKYGKNGSAILNGRLSKFFHHRGTEFTEYQMLYIVVNLLLHRWI